ncbi:MAG: Asp-tRNA(Asn)/Glu-tRNA(Gln) amidotransferase GatCAB subunit A [Nanoarchaeota archaeon]|jgi:aspartyl-tRNA(Asn)/glutamyl-tRNA(Gln) amidotransferase subunit A|nr:Asp-tRNA(Asn)/Glu-tRNA(Gln) amidotransferase GatCAB subunit A [Nanoarchaeota archaeon]|tara:strand:+ start:29396 stop:30742 length:1347 start_codon:yes stop_codon:yes gene_type:complete
MNIQEYLEKVKNREISIVKIVEKITKEAKSSPNHFTAVANSHAIKRAEQLEKNPVGNLAGLPISIKDCICVKDLDSTAGSEILQNYRPPFNATVIKNLEKQGAIIIGKTSQDEFGFGSFSVNTKKIPKNPYDQTRSCGGSSGGAAAFTSYTKQPHIALAESTGGSIANPASFCGVAGLTPTYGLISRYGLIDYANSLDKIGTLAKTVKDAFLGLYNSLSYDEKDSTSLTQTISKEKKVKKIAIVKESLEVDKDIKDLILSKVKDYDLISLPNVKKHAIPTYYIIAMSEASTNLAKYCGIRYGATSDLKGNFDEFFSSVRSKHFQKESKRRIILGTFARMSGFRDAYYLKAQKVRTLIINEYKKAFKKYDILISPTMPIIAPKFSEIEKLTPLENYMLDTLTVGPNLAGLPHLSLNAGFKEKMPVGIMLTTNHLEEEKLRTLGEEIEDN